jgi:hypothetical protein
LFFRGEGQALASSFLPKTKREKLRKRTRREEKKREPKGDIKNRQIFPAVKTFYFLTVKTCEFGSKERLEQKSGNVRALLEMRRAEEKISLISGSTAEDVNTN